MRPRRGGLRVAQHPEYVAGVEDPDLAVEGHDVAGGDVGEDGEEEDGGVAPPEDAAEERDDGDL